ncbi:MAG: DUF4388 domain-containing protein [bacterium]|nr:DUF4388 domain-containing protein [bacterium]
MFQNTKVLVVDDDDQTLRVVKEALIQNGFVVHFANHFARAVQVAAKHKPDLVLSRFRLGEARGLRFMEQLKRVSETRYIPVVFMTATERPSDKVHALEAGAEDFITLPFDTTEFMARLNVVLRRSKQNRVTTLSPADGIKGDLKDINLIDLIQLFDMGRKTAVIQVEGQGKQGRIYFENGALVHAISGKLFGKEGLFDLFTIEAGRFLVHLHIPSKIRTIQEASTKLVMEAMHRLDQKRGPEGKEDETDLQEGTANTFLYTESIKELFEQGVIEEQGKT